MQDVFIKRLQDEIAPLRKQLVGHALYASIKDIQDIRKFMTHHVYAVWDFMSLLKSLQRELTCVSIPWVPVGYADTRFLINEIVTGEESDVDEDGNRLSHFELYLSAMEQIGCDMDTIKGFIAEIRSGMEVEEAMDYSGMPRAAREFVGSTFDIIASGKSYLQAAAFTFGREDLIPDMFLSMVNELVKQNPGKMDKFKYYLERHIEVDGGHHSHLAQQMTGILCGDDAGKWEECTTICVRSLESRIALWDAIHASITRVYV